MEKKTTQFGESFIKTIGSIVMILDTKHAPWEPKLFNNKKRKNMNCLSLWMNICLCSACSCATEQGQYKYYKEDCLKEIVINFDEQKNDTFKLKKVNETLLNIEDPNSAPRRASHAEYHRNKLFILDETQNRGLYVYNNSGAQLFHYNNIGIGDKQSRSITDFTIGKNNIYINDFSGSKTVILDMNGEVVGIKDYKQFASNKFYVDETNNIVYADNNNEPSKGRNHSLYYYINGSDTISKMFLPIPQELKYLNSSAGESFWKIGKDIHYYTGLRNTVYSIGKNGVRPIYHLNFGKSWPSKEFIKSAKNDIVAFYTNIRNTDYVYSVQILETKNILVIPFMKNKMRHAYLFNKKTNEELLLKIENAHSIVGLNGDNLLMWENTYKGNIITEHKIIWK